MAPPSLRLRRPQYARASSLALLLLASAAGACDADTERHADGGGTGAPDVSDTGARGADAGGGDAAIGTGGSAAQGDGGDGSGGVDGAGGEGGDPLGDPLLVVVGYGARRVWSPDGLDYQDLLQLDPEGGDDENLFRGLAYGEGRWVAVGGAGGGFSMVSTDGKTWGDDNRNARAFISDAVYLDGMFVAAGGNGLRVRSIDGGETWIDDAGYFAGHFRAIAAGNGVAVAVGHTYGRNPDVGIIATTADGQSWTLSEGGATFGSVAFGNGVFVVAGASGRVERSIDGDSWQPVTIAGAAGQIAFAAGEFLCSTASGYARSADGMQWQPLGAPSARTVVGHFHGHYLSFGWPATISASNDLQSWAETYAPGGSGFTDAEAGVPSD